LLLFDSSLLLSFFSFSKFDHNREHSNRNKKEEHSQRAEPPPPSTSRPVLPISDACTAAVFPVAHATPHDGRQRQESQGEAKTNNEREEEAKPPPPPPPPPPHPAAVPSSPDEVLDTAYTSHAAAAEGREQERDQTDEGASKKEEAAAVSSDQPQHEQPQPKEKFSWREWLASEEECWRWRKPEEMSWAGYFAEACLAHKSDMARSKAELARTDHLGYRETCLKTVLRSAETLYSAARAKFLQASLDCKPAIVAARTEMTRPLKFAARAATAATVAAAAVASAETPAARAEANEVAETAAGATVAAARAAFAGDAVCFDRVLAAARAAAAKGLEHQRQQSADGASDSGCTAAESVVSDRATLVTRLRSFVRNVVVQSWIPSPRKTAATIEPTAAPIQASVVRAAFANRLQTFAENNMRSMLDLHISAEEGKAWMDRAVGQGHLDTHLYYGLSCFYYARGNNGDVCKLASDVEPAMAWLRRPLEDGSALAQYATGMPLYIFDCDSGDQEDFLDAARWIRKAAKQKLKEAQYELGEMFRLFRDVDNMRSARKYLLRASRHGQAEAIERMKELRICAFCGGADAPRACGLCRKVRYCDMEQGDFQSSISGNKSTCCVKHWREGGGVGGGISGGAGERYKDVCPRTHAAADDSDDDSDEEEEEEE
jgi:TPR repeat protein